MVERFGANPPIAGWGAVEGYAAVVQGADEYGKVKAGIGHGVAQLDLAG
ncbi:MAG: hypothetical protein ABR987_13550 [Terracidiphilus sp.]